MAQNYLVMNTIRFTLLFLAISWSIFQISTCSYVECRQSPNRKVADIHLYSGQLHNTTAHLYGRVVSTISIPGFKVYYLQDNSGAILMVKTTMGSGVPARGASLKICGVVHEVINLNDAVKWVVLEELSRENWKAAGTSSVNSE